MKGKWKVDDLARTASLVVDVLKTKKYETGNGVTRIEVRNEALLKMKRKALLDAVLAEMNNVHVDGYIVTRGISPWTDDVYKQFPDPFLVTKDLGFPESPENRAIPTFVPEFGESAYEDIESLFQHILSLNSNEIKDAVTTIQMSVNFTREWPLDLADDSYLRFICRVYGHNDSVEEQLIVPLNATIYDLKAAAEVAIRETYCIMENFKVMEIVVLEGESDCKPISGKLLKRSEIAVRGSGVDLVSGMIHEGGKNNRVVKCKCGATDDDGEIMIQCEVCEMWLHTQCCGLDDEALPPNYSCGCI
ncbi:hypothetical protein LXL04_028243 [Taraxacum kok-saghyz]